MESLDANKIMTHTTLAMLDLSGSLAHEHLFQLQS